MSENEYVATAAAQKRLREVLTGYLGHIDSRIVETFADALLAVAQVEYKPRAKAVLITLPLPDKAALSESGTGMDLSQAVTETEGAGNELGAEPEPEAEIVKAPPQPHIAPFQPKQYGADDDFEDVHYD